MILDEIGRGTSTYDGLSLAWAIVEHLHDHVGCRTLFATHYHELTDLASTLPGVVNLNVSVKEWEDQVVFLHKIVPGAADKSYGIHVARLAGVPRSVNERAKQILAQLEAEHLDEQGRPRIGAGRAKRPRGDIQLTLFAPMEHPLLDTIREMDVDRLTPLEALQLLHKWQAELEGGASRQLSTSPRLPVLPRGEDLEQVAVLICPHANGRIGRIERARRFHDGTVLKETPRCW